MNPDKAACAIRAFPRKYARDWAHWRNTYEHWSSDGPDTATVAEFGRILRSWQAARPLPMRRPRNEANHPAPYLDDLLLSAWPYLNVTADLSIRDIDCASTQQIEALHRLWGIFLDLTAEGRATCVGITKSILLLTEGRIGPALDSTVRRSLDITKPTVSSDWIGVLCAVCSDLKLFERRHGIRIESLVPPELAPINVGRVYDMIAGPHDLPKLGGA